MPISCGLNIYLDVVCTAAADERPGLSTRVHSTAQEGNSRSWSSLLHATKPLIAVVAATTGTALLAQLFFRCVTVTAAHVPFALHAADCSCACSAWATVFDVADGPSLCCSSGSQWQNWDQLALLSHSLYPLGPWANALLTHSAC